MNLLTAFAQHEVNEIMKATDHSKLTQSHVDSVTQKAVDYALEKFAQREALEKLEALMQPGIIVQYQTLRYGPFMFVAVCERFPRTTVKEHDIPWGKSRSRSHERETRTLVECHIAMFERGLRGGFTFKSSNKYQTPENENYVVLSAMLEMAVEGLSTVDRERPDNDGERYLSELITIVRPDFDVDAVVTGPQHALSDLVRENTSIQMMVQVEDEAHHTLITNADRIFGGVLVNYERELVRVATHARTGLTQMRSNLRGRVEELIANANTASPVNNTWWGSW